MPGRRRSHTAEDAVPESSEAVFAILGNQTRLAILFALAEAERESGPPVPFSDIFRRVSVRDSSKFNYHLKQLCRQFVAREDDGYRLRHVGRLVYRAINAEAYAATHEMPPTEIESQCVKCDALLVATYSDNRLVITCDDCGDIAYRISIPPAAFADRSLEAFLHAADQRIRADITLVGNGICPACSGRTTPALRDAATAPTDNVYVNHDCQHCGQRILSTTVGELLLFDPDVVSFCRAHDVDLTARPCWEVEFCVSDDHVTVVSADPWVAAFDLTLDGETLHIELDDAFEKQSVSID